MHRIEAAALVVVVWKMLVVVVGVVVPTLDLAY